MLKVPGLESGELTKATVVPIMHPWEGALLDLVTCALDLGQLCSCHPYVTMETRVDYPYRSLDDEGLIRLIEQARGEALSELYDRYGRLVFSLALNSVGDPATAEEVTQDVFLRVWQRAGQYRPDRGKVSTWLTSITRHRAIDQLRRRGVRPEQHSVGWAEISPRGGPVAKGPEEATALALERERVRTAVADLPEEQRQVLALAYFQGLSQSQIAKVLGLPLGTTKTRIRLGMQKLRQALL
jgi:RNA polymerase sigma-70 factor (ECF subfamily)